MGYYSRPSSAGISPIKPITNSGEPSELSSLGSTTKVAMLIHPTTECISFGILFQTLKCRHLPNKTNNQSVVNHLNCHPWGLPQKLQCKFIQPQNVYLMGYYSRPSSGGISPIKPITTSGEPSELSSLGSTIKVAQLIHPTTECIPLKNRKVYARPNNLTHGVAGVPYQ